MSRLFSVLAAITLFGTALLAQPTPFPTISYQGLMTQSGVPVSDATYGATFQIFAAASGGPALWTEAQGVTTVNGIYEIELGSVTPLAGLYTGKPLWLGITFGTLGVDPELTPRTLLSSVTSAMALALPYNATQAESVPLVRLENTDSGDAILAYNTGTGTAGAFIVDNAANINSGVFGQTNGTGAAMFGETTGTGHAGKFVKNNSSSVAALYAETISTQSNTYAVHGKAAATSGGGYSAAVRGENLSTTGSGIGVHGSQAGGGWGVHATSVSGRGMFATSESGTAIYGASSSTSGVDHGVYGETLSNGGAGGYFTGYQSGTTYGADIELGGTVGVIEANVLRMNSGGSVSVNIGGAETNWFQVFGPSQSAMRVYGGGDIQTFGNFSISGYLSKSGGSFRIDHPLDPDNRFLSHSFVESPDMMNVYNGNVTTDADGFATVELPDYFNTLNRDYRYQLTVIGSFARAMVAEEVTNNRFVILTDEPAVKVSWQVTGIRQDAWAEGNRIKVEEDKAPDERGYYLYPEGFGKTADRQLGAQDRDEAQVASEASER